MPRLARSCGGSRFRFSPSKMISPARTGRNPMMLSMVVVLPAPLRPTRQTTSLAPTSSDTPCRMCAAPRIGVDRLDLEHGQSFRVNASGPDVPSRTMATCSLLPDLVGRALGENGALGHDHDPVGVFEHHVHVVLDDHRGDALAAHDRGDGVHDLALVAGATRRWSARRGTAAWASARRPAPRRAACARPARGRGPFSSRFAGEPELAEDAVGLGRHRVIEVGERAQAARSCPRARRSPAPRCRRR